jgi:tripartite-type tricarboxylate transporter receptor subunit TctC
MRLPRRRFLHLAAGTAALPAASRLAWAQTYPSRPVHLIAGFPPGGIVDTIARLIGQWLSGRLGQPFVIENRAGAGSNIATELVTKAQPDGYTLLLVSSVNAWNTAIYDNLKFNFIRDIAPIASIIHTPGVMEVNPSVPAKTVPEFIVEKRSFMTRSIRLPPSITALRKAHSITSSARASSVTGTVRPSAVAVLRLSTNTYLVGA